MKTVLIVDDSEIDRLIHQKFWANEASHGNTYCFQWLRSSYPLNEYFQRAKSLPNIILLDLNMPVMDGSRLLKVSRLCLWPARKFTIVIVTSSSSRLDIQKLKKKVSISIWRNLSPKKAFECTLRGSPINSSNLLRIYGDSKNSKDRWYSWNHSWQTNSVFEISGRPFRKIQ